jgi:formylglycine-generating enzyme required for sulfatase activity
MKMNRRQATVGLIFLLPLFIYTACKSKPPAPAPPSPASLFGQDAGKILLAEDSYVRINAGEFLMGSKARGEGGEKPEPDEFPQHKVVITKSFEIGKFEVTQKQWQAVMGSNPSVFKGPALPVINVSWYDAQDFIKRVQTMDDRYIYRLPTEAEWEYACRAPSPAETASGESVPDGKSAAPATKPATKALRARTRDELARAKKLEIEQALKQFQETAWYLENAQNRPHAVGQLKANARGIYDLLGNVGEWVEDWYDRAYYKFAPVEDPRGPEFGQIKVVRGGDWQSPASFCRPTSRGRQLPVERNHLVGFRLMRIKKQ